MHMHKKKNNQQRKKIHIPISLNICISIIIDTGFIGGRALLQTFRAGIQTFLIRSTIASFGHQIGRCEINIRHIFRYRRCTAVGIGIRFRLIAIRVFNS